MNIKRAMIVTLLILSQIAAMAQVRAEPAAGPEEANSYGPHELILYLDSSKIVHDGAEYAATHETVVKSGVTYVGLRSVAERLGYAIGHDVETKETLLTKEDHEIRYTLDSNAYTVDGVSRAMAGAPYADRGVYMVPLRSLADAADLSLALQDDRITLSWVVEPIEPPKPNEPPVAYFVTDKEKYRMGEPIKKEDQSTDDEDAIVERKWENDQPAFFEPGTVEIRLTVTDKHGASSVYSKRIEITSETLYTKEEFDRLFTPPGSNFDINGGSILGFEPLPYSYTTEPYTLFRASGPETVNSEGILYQDTIAGRTRFMIHHMNNMGEKAKFYVIAGNANAEPANIGIESLGIAGPTNHPEVAGRQAAARYFQSFVTGSERANIRLEAGESKVIFTGLSSLTVSSGDIITLNADAYGDAPIQYTVVMIKEGGDPLELVSVLPDLDPGESIVRGTFPDSTRVFEYRGPVGNRPQRLPLTDNTTDPFQQGIDGIKHTPAINSGNYGVLYKIVLHDVAPNTLITFNPRGGLYSGAAKVNGDVVHIKHIGSTQDSTSVLYRTKDRAEKVEIWITPAAGSNLPFALLFMPLPERKG